MFYALSEIYEAEKSLSYEIAAFIAAGGVAMCAIYLRELLKEKRQAAAAKAHKREKSFERERRAWIELSDDRLATIGDMITEHGDEVRAIRSEYDARVKELENENARLAGEVETLNGLLAANERLRMSERGTVSGRAV